MSEAETPVPAAEGAEAAPTPPPKPTPPARILPSQEEIADWYNGADCESIDNLFNNLAVMKLDILVMQIRKEELLPQHWQILENVEVDEEVFDRLPEIGALRVHYKNQELARARTEALRVAWRELRGKRPNLWTVPDLLAAMRRIIDKKFEVNFHDLLSATRDIWAGMSIPFGLEQREILWAVVSFVRKKTKK
jgi:hypothetical protein